MKLLNKIKYKFSGFFGTPKSGSVNIANTVKLTSEFAAGVLDISDFYNMPDEEIYEQLFVWDTDAGGAADRISSLVSMAFNRIIVRDDDSIEDDIEKEMLRDAKLIYEQSGMSGTIEAASDLMLMQGNVFALKNKDKSISFLPNKYCTLVPDASFIGSMSAEKLIMQTTILVLNEMSNSELDQLTFKPDGFIHIKYKDTPVFMNDSMGRKTFGVYSVSPMHRAVLPIWWKRQMMIIDALVRSRNVPREHHKINSESFNGSGGSGSISEREQQRQSEFDLIIENYAQKIKSQTPEQGFVTSDGIDISILESNTKYTEPNELLKQLKGDIYTGLNIPPSVVDGSGSGSYASELVISNYVSAKIIHLANRIKPMILDNLRERLLLVNGSYPVEKLDFSLNLSLTESNLDVYRVVTLMKDSGVYTEDEIRKMSNDLPIPDNRRDEIVNPSALGKVTDVSKSTTSNIMSGGGTNETTPYPETAQSEVQHSRDASENVLNSE